MLATEPEHLLRLLVVADGQARLEHKFEQLSRLRVVIALALPEVRGERRDAVGAQLDHDLVEEELLPVNQGETKHDLERVLPVHEQVLLRLVVLEDADALLDVPDRHVHVVDREVSILGAFVRKICIAETVYSHRIGQHGRTLPPHQIVLLHHETRLRLPLRCHLQILLLFIRFLTTSSFFNDCLALLGGPEHCRLLLKVAFFRQVLIHEPVTTVLV